MIQAAWQPVDAVVPLAWVGVAALAQCGVGVRARGPPCDGGTHGAIIPPGERHATGQRSCSQVSCAMRTALRSIKRSWSSPPKGRPSAWVEASGSCPALHHHSQAPWEGMPEDWPLRVTRMNPCVPWGLWGGHSPKVKFGQACVRRGSAGFPLVSPAAVSEPCLQWFSSPVRRNHQQVGE